MISCIGHSKISNSLDIIDFYFDHTFIYYYYMILHNDIYSIIIYIYIYLYIYKNKTNKSSSSVIFIGRT